MKRPIFFSHVLLLLAFSGLAADAGAAPPPESCRQIVLKGKVEVPANFPAGLPVQLTLTYQLNYMKKPAMLVTSYPLRGREFEVTLLSVAPFVRKKLHLPIKIPESFPESRPESMASPWSLPESVPESQPETQADPDRLKLDYVAKTAFLYPREVDFQYFAQTQDGRFKSGYLKTHYLHEKKQIDGKWGCESEVSLNPVVLQGK